MTAVPTIPARQANNRTVREVERASIRAFVENCAHELGGAVLDYGCGLQPYRDIVEAVGGEYTGYDRAHFAGNVSREDVGPDAPLFGPWDAILCNQVVQYIPLYTDGREPWLLDVLEAMHESLTPTAGHLVLTYPTNWAEVEQADRHRFTKAGMTHLVEMAGFAIRRHVERAAIDLGGFRLPLGYGLLAQA